MCSCDEPTLEENAIADAIAVCVSVFGNYLWVPIDTAAYSIWVDKTWFLKIGEE